MHILKKTSTFFRLNFSLLILLFLTRVFELFLLDQKQMLPNYAYLIELKGFAFDMLFWLSYSFWTFILFFITSRFSYRAANIIHYTISFIVLIINIQLIQFFAQAGTALDHAIFSHSLSEIILTTWAGSQESGLLILVPTLILSFLFIFLVHLLKKIHPDNFTLYTYLIISFLSLFFTLGLNDEQDKETEFTYHMRTNKILFFSSSAIDYLLYNNRDGFPIDDIEVLKTIQEYQSQHPDIDFISQEFPLIHHNSSNSTLSPYFIKSNSKPNIVIINTESLSRAFVGKDAYMGHFMPFLDSLINHSLFWENCLSTTVRTFGVLPAVLGSLPLAQSGFMALQENMPNHETLISILKDNTYYTSFFHEGPLGFDYMIDFIKRQDPNYIMHFDSYLAVEKDYNKTTGSWGASDDILFKNATQYINSMSVNPRLDVYLTLTTHSPFIYPHQDAYMTKAQNLNNKLQISEKTRLTNEKYLKQLGSFLYLDDAFRELFNDYKRRPDFNQTIFIITGDHRMATPALNQLDKYHVPLIIYSPLLTEAKTFPAIVSHQDIVPSILNLLNTNYNIPIPDTVHWLSNGLNTSSTFQAKIDMPFMLNNRNIVEYIFNDKFYYKDKIYQIEKDLRLSLITNDSLRQMLENKIEIYKKLNNYIIAFDKLMPLAKAEDTIELYNNKLYSIATEHSDEFLTINSKIAIPKNIVEIKFEAQFKIKSNIDSQIRPLLIIELKDSLGNNVLWQKNQILKSSTDDLSKNKWDDITISKKLLLSKYTNKENLYIRAYFWNNEKVHYNIKNLNISILGVEKDPF